MKRRVNHMVVRSFFRTFAKEMIGVRDEGNMSGVRDEEENYFKQIEGIVETKE